MHSSKKRPTFRRLVITLILGLIVSAGILMLVQQVYEPTLKRSALIEPFFYLAGISTLLIALFLVFPANKPYRLFKWMWRLLILGVAGVLLWSIGGFWIAQNHMIYQADRREMQAEAFLDAQQNVEEIRLTDQDQSVYHGYIWKTMPGKAGLILYFGGNGEEAAGRMMALMQSQAKDFLSGYHVMAVDYPGYGKSTGKPTEESIYRMAQLAYNAAISRPEVDASRLVLVGWSLGTGPVSMLASKIQIAGMVLMTPFLNGTELVKSFLENNFKAGKTLTAMAGWMVRNKFPSDQYAKTVSANARVLVLGARQDSAIPYGQAEQLASHYPNVDFVLLEGGHDAPWTELKSYEAMKAFLEALNPSPAP